jgi:hypothetical protein
LFRPKRDCARPPEAVVVELDGNAEVFMFRCPHCNNPLTSEEQQGGICPACATSFQRVTAERPGTPPVTALSVAAHTPPLAQQEKERQQLSERSDGENDAKNQVPGLGAILKEYPARSFAKGVLLPTVMAFASTMALMAVVGVVLFGIALANGKKVGWDTIREFTLYGVSFVSLLFATITFFVYLRTSRLGMAVHERGLSFSDGTILRVQDIAQLTLTKRKDVEQDLFIRTIEGRTIAVSNLVVPPIVLEEIFNLKDGKFNK